MNIILPIGGVGKRFSEEGYSNPKPLIKSLGKPILFWNLENLNVKEDDVIYIIYREEFKSFNFEGLINNKFRNYRIKFVPIKNETRGAAETVLYAINQMDEFELNQLTLVVDSDNFYKDDIVELSKKTDNNLIFFHNDNTKNPIFSYIETNDSGYVVDIKEKIKISDKACVGAYCFKSSLVLKETIMDVLIKGEKQNNEYYISSLYKNLIDKNINVFSIEVQNFVCLGTPKQLKTNSSNISIDNTKYRFCFDIDNTLVTFPKTSGDYSTVEPISKTINFCNFLYDQGHTIILHTARRMKTHRGNVGSVIADISKITIDTLEKFGIKYNELYFGKPYADFYIDDLSINPFSDLEKETGFYNIHPETRKHNKLEIFDNHIVKYSESIDGEKFFYENIDTSISHLFPKLLDSGKNFITLSKINGIPISFLNINKTLTEEILLKILTSLELIHSCKINNNFEHNIYSNYNEKLISRLNSYNFSEYNDFDNVKNEILNYLSNYEKENRGTVGVVHGDPVLTNILIDNHDQLKFIDMRGKLGDSFSIHGDIFYDYAKIYQSIVGYDFILMDKLIDNDYILKNKKVFENFVVHKFGKKTYEDIKVITKSLLLSLIPIHDNNKCENYYKLINKI